MKLLLLTTLGCIFWLLPFAAAVHPSVRYGFYEDGFGFNYDSLPLLGIPILMTCLTLLLAYLAKHRRLHRIAFAASSSIPAVAVVYWLALWGKGI
jgi:hypothetical protein